MKKELYTICFDTICNGYQPVMCNDEPQCFISELSAQTEIDSDPEFYEDCFACPYDEIGHKTIYTTKEDKNHATP